VRIHVQSQDAFNAQSGGSECQNTGAGADIQGASYLVVLQHVLDKPQTATGRRVDSGALRVSRFDLHDLLAGLCPNLDTGWNDPEASRCLKRAKEAALTLGWKRTQFLGFEGKTRGGGVIKMKCQARAGSADSPRNPE
jgi:hypothetical protein